MNIESDTRFFDCVCGCNAIGVARYAGETDVSIEVWEPRGYGGTSLRWRIGQAWRVLRGRGSAESTILTNPNARVLGMYLLSITEPE